MQMLHGSIIQLAQVFSPQKGHIQANTTAPNRSRHQARDGAPAENQKSDMTGPWGVLAAPFALSF